MISFGPVRVGVVVPAAGRSRRMGRSKPLLQLGETDFIGVILETCGEVASVLALARPSGDWGGSGAGPTGRVPGVVLGPVAVVHRAEDEPLAHRLSGLRESIGELALVPVPLPSGEGDMLWSVRQGARALAARSDLGDAPDWLLVWPVDGPLSLAETVSAVVREAARGGAALVAPAVGAATGHPVAVPADLLLGGAWGESEGEAGRSPGGLGRLVEQAGLDLRTVETSDPGCLLNANTPEAYDRLRALWARAERGGRGLRGGQDAIG